MALTFLICVMMMAVLGLADPSTKENPKALAIDASMFKTNRTFAVGAGVIIVLLVTLYSIFW
jgi:SSS family solute:Na+ symporter